MINVQALGMYLVGWVTVSLLIYRYARYSRWRSTLAGQSVMMVKCSLWCVLTWALVAVLLPNWEGRDIARVLLLGFVDIALFYQLYVIVKYQGGIRRRREPTDDDASLPH